MDVIFLLKINFAVYCAVFAVCLIKNFNFNIILVGLTYLAPLVPLGMSDANIERFIIVSYCNLIFGIIEVIFFALTERPEDSTFNKAYFQQLWGHVLPIVIALIGMSFVSRASEAPVQWLEAVMIALLFLVGSTLRIWAVAQLGVLRFKFNIAFREKQTLKTDGLHGLTRHPTYTAMMLVVLAYAITTHSWLAGVLGTLSALFGFQYRIHFEELALKEQFGEEYDQYRSQTPMWLPIPTYGKAE
ncbi:MAG: isoprenylcysteine carboxylmethyltransferase family protein [Nitrospinae bacterium]|nr:isoprenylcysteine carboxylmethyltransferase family protein [Nitrospinota bacterium]MBL7021638.1 isoprenylcysteine carboxylmethyltransferase family protein [Nitrospinaceae bacterium]